MRAYDQKNWCLNHCHIVRKIMPTLKANEQLLRTKDFFALEVDLRLWRNVCSLSLISTYEKLNFSTFFLSCWKPLVPDGFWFLCYLLQVLRKISFLLLIDINMWHYKEYSPSSYMWKKKLWRIKKNWKKNRLRNSSNCTIHKKCWKPSQFDEFFLHFILP